MNVDFANQNHNQCQSQQCPLCQGQNFSVMLNRALYDRYLANINLYYADSIDDFMEGQITVQTCKFKQQMCNNDDQQYMKRQYRMDQFKEKMQALSEYYKFHRDYPKVFQQPVFKILGKYNDQRRRFDYKKIKHLLKEEQGISLTTEQSDQSSFYSNQIVKSRYSTVLYDLNTNSQSQSQILQDFCKKVDKAYEKLNIKRDFKGKYFSGQKKFQQYLLNLKKPNSRQRKVQFAEPNLIKNYNLLHKPFNNTQINSFSLKTQRIDGKKKCLKKKTTDIMLNTNNALKQSLKCFKKNKNKNTKSIQKTTANQTISRQEKSKRIDKLQKTLEYEIQKNQNNIFKPFSTTLLALKSNSMLKTLDQIYKPFSVNQKYHSDKESKNYQQAQNLNKIYENKLSGRRSSSKIKSNVASAHNSKQNCLLPAHFIADKDVLQSRPTAVTQRKSYKDLVPSRSSTKKQLSRNRSSSKNLQTQKKNYQNKLKTIQYPIEKHLSQKTMKKKSLSKYDLKQNRLNTYLHQKIELVQSQSKPQQLRQRSLSKKSLHSGKKQRSSSKKNLLSSQKIQTTKKIQRSSSKSNVISARTNNIDKVKFHTIDPQANRNMDQFLQKKLKIVTKNKPKAKFYD